VPRDVHVCLANQYAPCGLKTSLSVTLRGLRSLLHPISPFSFYSFPSEDESDISYKVIRLQIKQVNNVGPRVLAASASSLLGLHCSGDGSTTFRGNVLNFYQTTRRNFPGDDTPNGHSSENFKCL
jgi:hypothetical protein